MRSWEEPLGGIGPGELRIDLGRPDLRIHDLRHTFATILSDAGASEPDVQATLGHSSLQVTERYSRAREDVAKRAGACSTRPSRRAFRLAPLAQRPVTAQRKMAQKWHRSSDGKEGAARRPGKLLIYLASKQWLRPASIR